MAGTNVDLSGYLPGQPYKGTCSATVDEVDVISGIPGWCKYISRYSTNLARIGHPASEVMTNSDVLEDADPHKPLPAGAYFTESHYGGDHYISSGTSANPYVIVLHSERP